MATGRRAVVRDIPLQKSVTPCPTLREIGYGKACVLKGMNPAARTPFSRPIRDKKLKWRQVQ